MSIETIYDFAKSKQPELANYTELKYVEDNRTESDVITIKNCINDNTLDKQDSRIFFRSMSRHDHNIDTFNNKNDHLLFLKEIIKKFDNNELGEIDNRLSNIKYIQYTKERGATRVELTIGETTKTFCYKGDTLYLDGVGDDFALENYKSYTTYRKDTDKKNKRGRIVYVNNLQDLTGSKLLGVKFVLPFESKNLNSSVQKIYLRKSSEIKRIGFVFEKNDIIQVIEFIVNFEGYFLPTIPFPDTVQCGSSYSFCVDEDGKKIDPCYEIFFPLNWTFNRGSRSLNIQMITSQIQDCCIIEKKTNKPETIKSDVWATVNSGNNEEGLDIWNGSTNKLVYYGVNFYDENDNLVQTIFNDNISEIKKLIGIKSQNNEFIKNNETNNGNYYYSWEEPQSFRKTKNTILGADEEIFKLTLNGLETNTDGWICINNNNIYRNKDDRVSISTTGKKGRLTNPTQMSQSGIRQIADHEGRVEYVYTESVGAATFGYGHSYAAHYANYAEEQKVWESYKKKIDNESQLYYKEERDHIIVYYNGSNELAKELKLRKNNQISFDRDAAEKISNNAGTLFDIKVPVSDSLIDSCFKRDLSRYLRTAWDAYLGYASGVANHKDNWQNKIEDWAENNYIGQYISREQFEAIVSLCFQGNGAFFNKWLGESGARTKKANYYTFCHDAVKAIEYVEDQIRTGALGEHTLRGKNYREYLKKIFTVNKNSFEDSRDINDSEDIKIKKIEITCNAKYKIKIIETMKQDYWYNLVSLSLDDYKETNTNSFIYSIEHVGSKIEAEDFVVSDSELKLEEIDDFLKKWVVNSKSGDISSQSLLDVNGYYDFYSGMTPYIEASFKNGENGWRTINSKDHPYFKSLTVEDTGVKKAELVLFDKDFASYQYGVFSNGMEKIINKKRDDGKYPAEVYSLESLIKEALNIDIKTGDAVDTGEHYEPLNEESTISSEYLKISNYTSSSKSYENLRIRYGYCDYNPIISHEATRVEENNDNITKKTVGTSKIVVDDEKYFNYFKSKNNNAETERTSRWWDVSNGDASKVMDLEGKFKINSGKYETVDSTTFSNRTAEIIASENRNVGLAQDKKIQSYDQTTSMSYDITYMITDLKTSLKPNGIEYHISAIESINSEVMSKRFLQRYAEISTYPLEVLYLLMRIFNEDNAGRIPQNTPKILLLDEQASGEGFVPSKWMNMRIDSSKLTEEQVSKLKSVYTNEIDGEIKPEWLKNISLKFGSEDALKRNYAQRESGVPGLYKSVASLMDDFCYACPPKKAKSTEEVKKGYDENGNELQKSESFIDAPLRWTVVKNDDTEEVTVDGKKVRRRKDDTVYIVLYYRKPTKIPKIRKYTWGPENFYKSVVKNINIQNNNEFAVLSGIKSFEGSNELTPTKFNTNSNNINDSKTPSQIYIQYKENDAPIPYNKIFGNTSTAEKYNIAYSNCMYSGSIDILGDPGLYFNTALQPYTYPIRLDIILPKNELYYKGFATTDWQNDYWDKKKDVEKKYGSNYYVGNQRLHEMSGYYVIAKITHNISPSGFTTTLDISSYPGIEKDVLINTSKILS